MLIKRQLRNTSSLALSLAMFTSLGLAASAQEATVQGLVIGRDGPSMAVRTSDTPRLTVLLSDTTKATEKGGFLGLSHKDLGIAELVPGLSVKVEGAYNPDHQLIAKKIVFTRNSLVVARQIDAGLNPVNGELASAQDKLKSHDRTLEQNQQDIDATKQGLASTNQATAGNTSAIGQTNQRVGSLDQFETKDTITVNFANGKAVVNQKDKDQLTEFVKAAANTPGFMIEVQGYASKTGSATLNQRLSQERADAVLAIIQQSGVVPMTRILAPAAMGTSNQVATEHTRTAQAQNRRVVVTIVVNKGIAG